MNTPFSPNTEDVGFIKAVADPAIPPGYCVAMLDGDMLYAGRIGVGMIPFIKSGVLLFLNPVDYVDGDEFMKKQTH